MFRLSLVVGLIGLLAASAVAADVSAKLVFGKAKAKAGETILATLVITVPTEHHAYAPPLGKDASPVVNVSLPAGSKMKLAKVNYPAGETKVYPGFGDMPLHVYEGVIKIPVKITLPKSASGNFKISVSLFYQICANSGTCFPPKTIAVSATVKIG